MDSAQGWSNHLSQNGEDTIHLDKAKSWLDERGYDGEKVFSEESIGEAREVCLRLWLEEDVGMDASALSAEEVNKVVEDLCREKGMSPPIFGKTVLYDGRTGERLDQLDRRMRRVTWATILAIFCLSGTQLLLNGRDVVGGILLGCAGVLFVWLLLAR